MYIKELELYNFRNYKRQKVSLCGGLNVFFGNNAQGKTNLLEAASLCSVGRSPRTPRDKELILWNETRAKVSLEVCKAAGKETIEIVIDKSENKRVAINKLPITKIGELMGALTTVFFSPAEIKIVGSSPGERRAFMDIALCQMSKAYFYLLSRYNKILSQRNKLLKSGKANEDSLYVWDMQLAGEGAKIIHTRREYIKRLKAFAEKNHGYLTGGAEKLELEYDGVTGEDAKSAEREFLSVLKQSRERDLALGYTHFGPQKDDLVIKSNGTDLRSFGSQGQIRTAALSLKLSELDLAYNKTGEMPVLLLDDVMSELDKNRRALLLKRIEGMQVILTCTEPDEIFGLSGNYKGFSVENGSVKDC